MPSTGECGCLTGVESPHGACLLANAAFPADLGYDVIFKWGIFFKIRPMCTVYCTTCGVWLNVLVDGLWKQQLSCVCLAAHRHRHQEYAKAHNLYYYGPNAVNGGQP